MAGSSPAKTSDARVERASIGLPRKNFFVETLLLETTDYRANSVNAPDGQITRKVRQSP
jgi:hypothetical protein